jgi:hypothetical protein
MTTIKDILDSTQYDSSLQSGESRNKKKERLDDLRWILHNVDEVHTWKQAKNYYTTEYKKASD